VSGRTGTEVVTVKSGDSTSLWRIVAGRGQVDVISQPALDGTVDSVSLRGFTGGTRVRVTANNSLVVRDFTGGGGSGGNVTIVFGANTWQIGANKAGPIFLRGSSNPGTVVGVTVNKSLITAVGVVTPGVGTVNLGKATGVDAGFPVAGSGPVGVMPVGVRSDIYADDELGGINSGDFSAFRVDHFGQLFITSDANFPLPVTEQKLVTGIHTNFTGNGTSQAIVPASSHKTIIIYNDSGVVVFIKFASGASATSYAVKLLDQTFYEVPFPGFQSVIHALWASGTVRVTRLGA
jgi:hypothetical protein